MKFFLKTYFILILILFCLFSCFICSINNRCDLKYNMSTNEHVSMILMYKNMINVLKI